MSRCFAGKLKKELKNGGNILKAENIIMSLKEFFCSSDCRVESSSPFHHFTRVERKKKEFLRKIENKVLIRKVNFICINITMRCVIFQPRQPSNKPFLRLFRN